MLQPSSDCLIISFVWYVPLLVAVVTRLSPSHPGLSLHTAFFNYQLGPQNGPATKHTHWVVGDGSSLAARLGLVKTSFQSL